MEWERKDSCGDNIEGSVTGTLTIKAKLIGNEIIHIVSMEFELQNTTNIFRAELELDDAAK
ncbi:hypothetical protein [Alicyclobacillus fodiniaquatilis]|uniref:Uncharacterized protein n=1 Tax=Alicyclobacillus fodiniaquatilis TaxID=1661150 RepID=A0ABW4JI18_9BACL